MAKQPYIQFYLGDYIKDTRVLPLNVKGGWVDLILAMWDNTPKGELIGTIEDYARIMNCSKEEANLVIQTLKQKKFFDYDDLGDGHMKIISRKQKKMEKLSEIRKNIGKSGGNPTLLNQKDNQQANQKHKQNPEYEYKDEVECKCVLDGVEGEGWKTKPGKEFYQLDLDEVKGGAVKQLFKISKNHNLTNDELKGLWYTFKIQNFTGEKFYQSPNDVFSHFINWSKSQNINGTHKQNNSDGKAKLGTSDARTEALRKW